MHPASVSAGFPLARRIRRTESTHAIRPPPFEVPTRAGSARPLRRNARAATARIAPVRRLLASSHGTRVVAFASRRTFLSINTTRREQHVYSDEYFLRPQRG